MATLNIKKLDKIIKKTEYKNIKNTISLVMYICDIIDQINAKNNNEDKIQLFLNNADDIAKKLIDEQLIPQGLDVDLNSYIEIVKDFYEMWGKIKKPCLALCIICNSSKKDTKS